MNKKTKPLPHSARQFVMVFLCVMAVTVGSTWHVLWESRQQTEANTRTELRNVTQIVDTHLDEMMRRIHANLRQIAEETPADAFEPSNVAKYEAAIRAKLIKLAVFFPEINSYRIYDAAGRCLYVSGPECPTKTIADRDYFIGAATHPEQELHYSSVIISRVSGKPVVSVAKAVISKEGKFLGVVNVGIDITHLSSVLANLKLGAKGIIALRSAQDLTLITRTPEIPDAVNVPPKPDYALREWLASGQKEITAHFVAEADHVARLYVTRRLEHYPFVILAGRSADDYLGEWRTMLTLTIFAELPFLLALSILLLRAWRESRAEHQRSIELAAARDKAEAANRAKSSFLANMSHELRTPLHGVMAMIEMAKRRMADPKGLDQLDKAKHSAGRLLGILNDILDLSNIEAERLVLEHAPLQLADCFDAVLAKFMQAANEKGLQLTGELSTDLGTAHLTGDAQRLVQVLNNLTDNAIKFTPQGKVLIRARCQEETGDALRVQFAVIDNGIGIDAAAQTRLFQSFEQADNSATRKFGGTGLGLALCKHLVERMGGKIDIESQLGEGSTFSFVIALQKRDTALSPVLAAQPAG